MIESIMFKAIQMSVIFSMLFACNSGIPVAISIDPAFTSEQRVVMDDALDQVCQATKFCPFVQDDSPNRIIADFDYARNGRQAGSAAFNDGDDIRVNMTHPALIDFDANAFWIAFAHEFLHYGIEGHTSDGLMSAFHAHPESESMCIDDVSANEWCKQSGDDGCKSTCP